MLGKTKGKRMDQYVLDYVVFDLETTGISPNDDEVVEISAVKVKKGKISDEFTSLINPQRPIPYGASRVNGITDEMVRKAPVFSEILTDFLHFIGDETLVGHNIQTFDMKFIWRDAERFYGAIPDNNYIDTLCLARNYLPKLSHHRLTDLAGYYHISAAGAHRALNDCRINQRVFECLRAEYSTNGAGKIEEKLCPVCGSPMKKRNGRYGEFWGCGGYPGCRYTENV